MAFTKNVINGCKKFNKRYNVNVTKEDIIRPYDKAIGTDGSIAVLRGNLAPEGAVIKHTACLKKCQIRA